MTDTMTIQAMLAEITLGRAQTPRYKVRAIREDGTYPRIVGGFGSTVFDLQEDMFLDAKDIEDRLMPSIVTENENMNNKVVRLEAYLVRETNVASIDLDVEEETTTVTKAGEWKPLD